MIRRLKAAKSLFEKNDINMILYDEDEVLRIIQEKKYHSPELSETDEENPEKRQVFVYDRSWRSFEVWRQLSSFYRFILTFL
jgi:hypothetical protein